MTQFRRRYQVGRTMGIRRAKARRGKAATIIQAVTVCQKQVIETKESDRVVDHGAHRRDVEIGGVETETSTTKYLPGPVTISWEALRKEIIEVDAISTPDGGKFESAGNGYGRDWMQPDAWEQRNARRTASWWIQQQKMYGWNAKRVLGGQNGVWMGIRGESQIFPRHITEGVGNQSASSAYGEQKSRPAKGGEKGERA